jgi:hypothetical protein
VRRICALFAADADLARALRRCFFAQPNRMTYFADVVLADIFTSYAKVIGDVWLSLCMLLPGGSLLRMPTSDGLQWLIVPALMRYVPAP